MDVGIEWIINGLNEVLDHDDTEVKIALETMAGKGNECGFTFEQLAKIYEGIHKNRVLAIVWIHVIFGMPGMILRILMKF